MSRYPSAGVAVLGLVLLVIVGGVAPAQETPEDPEHRALPTEIPVWTGDFDGMVERRVVRVLVPYSRTLYFTDKGHEAGLTADLMRSFERYINKKYESQLGKRPITVFIIPTTRDKLIPEVADGRGDFAAGNITVTESRQATVDFFAPPDTATANEIVLTGPKSKPVAVAEDLSGRTVHVRRSSSYYESLVALNQRLTQAGKPEATLTLVPDALEDEDMMEMLNAGLLESIVVDDWKAKIWAQILPKIKLHTGATVRAGAKIGWAIRKGSPRLQEILDEFYDTAIRKQASIQGRVARYHKRIRQMSNPTAVAEWKRFEETVELFRKYGAQYKFDPLMLAAQGYQESRLDQAAQSHVGAIGIMQIMPATGAELKVGDITVTEPNIHGGAKYMDQLMTRFFKDASFNDLDRTLFAFASYNAGPGNISRMRKEAEKRGLDPNQWFNNVEVVTAAKIGNETTTYVRNIYKYYAAYKLSLELQEAQQKAREQFAPAKP